MAEHARILQSRYKQLLGSIGNLDALTSQLYSQGLLSMVEKEEIKKRGNRIDKEAFLCSSLTTKGVSKLVGISQVLKNEQIRQGSSPEAVQLAGVVGGVGTFLGMEKWASPHEDVVVGEVGRREGRYVHDVGVGDVSREKPVSPGQRMPVFASKPHAVEDTHSVLFFTFITQLLHHFSGTLTTPKTTPTWLQVDLLVETTREYFSSRALKDVSPSERNPVAIKLSLLLESFQQFYHSFRSFKSKNLSLHEKLLEATKTKERLEAELNRMRVNQLQQSPQLGVMPYVPALSSGDRIIQQQQQLEAKKVEVEALKRSYIRSEQRCKQLVVVTQQWALECDDKVKLIHLQDQQLKELRAEVTQLDKRVNKYKKFWMEYKSGGPNIAAAGVGEDGRVSDFQFEELRTELAMRRELYDMVLLERDQAQKEVSRLVSELEAVKDHNVQLADRAANYQVQAKAKEPAVREMSVLLDENRRLKCELEAANMDRNKLQNRVKALETRSHTHPRRHEQQSESTDKGQPKSFLHSYQEEDTYSLSSSEGDSGSYYSSHNSTTSTTTTAQSGLTSFSATTSTGNRPGSANSSSGGARSFSQLESRDGSISYIGDSSPGNSGDLASSEAGFQDGMDYTRAIRYPNHSKIHVAPLAEEDRRLLKHPGGLEDRVGNGNNVEQHAKRSSGDKVAVQYGRMGYRDEGGAPNRVYRSDRICPACDFVFHSLSDAEFDAHKISCRGKSISI